MGTHVPTRPTIGRVLDRPATWEKQLGARPNLLPIASRSVNPPRACASIIPDRWAHLGAIIHSLRRAHADTDGFMPKPGVVAGKHATVRKVSERLLGQATAHERAIHPGKQDRIEFQSSGSGSADAVNYDVATVLSDYPFV
ncbi:MAG: hypothetical protein JWO52_958 [Gammaproteobacteria bacterium]|nr:hypothetical protein [Gammaproteobacteria bacterium]